MPRRRACRVVDAAEVDRHVEVERRVLAQELADGLPLRRVDDGRVVAEVGVRLEDRGAEPRLELVEDELAHVCLPEPCPASSC